MDTNEDLSFPRRDPFPQQLFEAARAFPHFSAAYAQFFPGAELHIEAPEIMIRFSGGVQLGKDPKGVLFYGSFSNITKAQFKVTFYQGPGSLKTVRVDFYVPQGDLGPKPIARFVTRVDTKRYKLPPVHGEHGDGEWVSFRAATSAADVLRQEDSSRFHLQIPPIGKEVYFDTTSTSSLKASGIFIFRDLEKLKGSPPQGYSVGIGCQKIVADYAPDKIVFYLKADDGYNEGEEVGLFLPDSPLKDIGQLNPEELPETTWLNYELPSDAT